MKKLALCLLACVLLFAGCTQQEQGNETQPPVTESQPSVEAVQPQEETEQQEVVEVDSPYIWFETPYCSLQMPAKNSEYLKNTEYSTDTGLEEVFSMEAGGNAVEIFRICFMDAAGEEKLGVLNTDQGVVPVSYTTCIFTREDFADEKSWSVYMSLMDGFSTMLDALRQDPRFSQSEPSEDMGVQTAALTYWTVELPADMSWHESTEEEQYRVVFRGKVAGAELELYAICLSAQQQTDAFGTYTVNGQDRSVVIENFELIPQEEWTEEQLAKVYTMKASINNVIEIITADPAFTAK